MSETEKRGVDWSYLCDGYSAMEDGTIDWLVGHSRSKFMVLDSSAFAEWIIRLLARLRDEMRRADAAEALVAIGSRHQSEIAAACEMAYPKFQDCSKPPYGSPGSNAVVGVVNALRQRAESAAMKRAALRAEVEWYQQLADETIVALGSCGLLPKDIPGRCRELRAEVERLRSECGAKELELKPCPFCGVEERDEEDREYIAVHRVGDLWQVWCDYCGALSHAKEDEDRAIAAWNRRAGDA